MPKSQYLVGQVFRLPPGSTDLDDWEWHFHALIAAHPKYATATLVYASTSTTDSRCGAPSIVVQPNSQNGLSRPTHFYGSIVVVTPQVRLGNVRGEINARMNDLRHVVKQAMGYRNGPGYDLPRGRSLRGRIVELTEKYASLYATKYAVLLTKHEYSVRERNQMLAPLYGSAPLIATGPVPTMPMPQSLQRYFEKGAENIYAPSELVRCLWHDKAIRSVTDSSLDAAFLQAIEDSLCIQWSL